MKILFDVVGGLLDMAWKLLKYPCYIAAVLLIVIILLYLGWYLYFRYYEGIRPISAKGKHYKVKEDFILKKVWLAIRQIAKDNLTRDPSEFTPHGGRIVAVCGKQGAGKTITATYLLNRYKAEYPLLKTATNYEYKYQDAEINHWRDMIKLQNGYQGYIIGLDEAQLWFNSRDYKNFDVAMLQEITTQRKQSKMVVMTTQSFHFLDKSIRCQVQEIHQCMTIGKAFTIVVVKEPVMTYDGEVEKLKWRKIYCFNHDEHLRNSYDTFKKIEVLAKKGFVDRSEQLGKPQDKSDNTIIVDSKSIKKKK